MHAIILSLIAFITTIIGGIIAIKYSDRLHTIISFSAGALIGVCFFDIVPEIFHVTVENNFEIIYPMIAVVAGFLTIHILQKVALIHGNQEEHFPKHHHPLVGMIGASGLAFHSFLDGVGIGLGFHINVHVGFAVALAVIAHDFCDGLNTVTLMLVNKQTRSRAIKLLALDALAPIFGVLSTYLFSISDKWLVIYLGFFAGFLLYIGASDLLPEAHSEKSNSTMLLLTFLGAAFIFVITRFA